MTDIRVEKPINRPILDVAALLGARPASWLRPFLRLAVRDAFPALPARPAGPPRPPLCRLGPPIGSAGDGFSVAVTWWPHLGDAAFTRFKGYLVCQPHEAGTLLRIEGTTRGGGDGVGDQVVVGRLLELLTAALEGSALQLG